MSLRDELKNAINEATSETAKPSIAYYRGKLYYNGEELLKDIELEVKKNEI